MDGRGWLETARRHLLFDERLFCFSTLTPMSPSSCVHQKALQYHLTVYNHKATNLNIQIALILKPAKVNKLRLHLNGTLRKGT